ncbi:Peptidoglycan D,D-transpeptidase MrdA [bioreactor metagenome]|uniref:Peptidoglycan D,D-transpeptidase MrdA n=1 Tax=bioreactor metagenome TaxID=1076179 RepID=A0A644ZUL7_9ZZZZ
MRITPVRGMMYDRNGILIVHNVPSFSITITPYEFRHQAMPLLSKILNIDSTEIQAILQRYRSYSRFTPIKILRDASTEIVAKVEEYSDHLPGVDIAIDSKRIYDFDCNMAHLLGYTREITGEQLKKYKYYNLGDMIGMNGIEQAYEDLLRGRDGVKFVAIDKLGQKVSSFENGKNDVLASNGFDLNLALDLQLQELAEKLLEGKNGAVVAIDPNNGEVMVFASKPDYDPRLFSGRVPAEIYDKLNNDPAKPLLPRALQSQYPPGSTWKMFIALAALQSGIINENTTVTCHGGYTLGNRTWKCHSACGAVNVRSAIRSSCNTFFCDIGVRLGMERFERYADMFNFGKRTEIDLPFEARGKLPTREWLKSRDKTIISFSGRLANYGIGQGEILTTPLQMAAYTATIANCGTYYQPHVVKSVYNHITKKTEELHFDSKKIAIDNKYFQIVKDGMWAVVNAGGTGAGVALPGLNVCGKTGTAQNPHGKDHSWFVCFAPKDKPRIAMCVFVENAGFGAAVAAPIAKQILSKFFYPEQNIVPQVNTVPDTQAGNEEEEVPTD